MCVKKYVHSLILHNNYIILHTLLLTSWNHARRHELLYYNVSCSLCLWYFGGRARQPQHIPNLIYMFPCNYDYYSWPVDCQGRLVLVPLVTGRSSKWGSWGSIVYTTQHPHTYECVIRCNITYPFCLLRRTTYVIM